MFVRHRNISIYKRLNYWIYVRHKFNDYIHSQGFETSLIKDNADLHGILIIHSYYTDIVIIEDLSYEDREEREETLRDIQRRLID